VSIRSSISSLTPSEAYEKYVGSQTVTDFVGDDDATDVVRAYVRGVELCADLNHDECRVVSDRLLMYIGEHLREELARVESEIAPLLVRRTDLRYDIAMLEGAGF